MKNQDFWNNWPLCPLKERDVQSGDARLGVLFADKKPTVYLTNMFQANDLTKVEKIEYASWDELVQVWRVD